MKLLLAETSGTPAHTDSLLKPCKMRLLDTSTLQFKEFDASSIPKYAILSHTWGSKEVLYKDLAGSHVRPRGPPEWEKIYRSCAIASQEGLSYIWIDSCCIDKSSSAELSEAINSMFRWYALAEKCIAYLEDVIVPKPVLNLTEFEVPDGLQFSFRLSRWFRKGQVNATCSHTSELCLPSTP
jgi:hypothetical protein